VARAKGQQGGMVILFGINALPLGHHEDVHTLLSSWTLKRGVQLGARLIKVVVTH
jgi:hypothetical protein